MLSLHTITTYDNFAIAQSPISISTAILFAVNACNNYECTPTYPLIHHPDALQGFKDFMNSDFMLGPIQTRVKAANTSINMQPDSSILEGYMVDMKGSVNQIKNVDFNNITASIRRFNSSLSTLGCVGGVINMLIVDINTSLVILPPDMQPVFDIWDDLQPQIANVSSQQASLQSGIDAITDLNSTLDGLPNFDEIIQQ